MNPTPEEFDAVLDAYAWVKATLLGDDARLSAIAMSTDPVALVDSLASMVACHMIMLTPDPIDALDRMSAHVVLTRQAQQ